MVLELQTLFMESLKESLVITAIIFFLMIIVELVVLKYKKRIKRFAKNNLKGGYILSSFFGSIPGCVGTFVMDSLYMSGLLSFGGLMAALISTSGDEAFLMLSLAATNKIPLSTILWLFATLFVLGVIGGYLADYIVKKKKIKVCEKCDIKIHEKDEFKLSHFIKEHIKNHIIKKHIWQIFLWVFAAIFLIGLAKEFINVDLLFSKTNPLYLLIIASVIGLLPISGPNVFLLMLFVDGAIPFSILLANSIIQDGHGLLPILGFSVDDAVKLKFFNFLFGIIIGLVLLLLGF